MTEELKDAPNFINLEDYARVIACRSLVKAVLFSLTPHVMSWKIRAMTKQQDELAFFKFVEDLCKLSFSE